MPGRHPRTVPLAHAALLVAALVALALKVVVPAGFMVAPDRPFTLVVCTQDGLATATAPVDQGRDDAPGAPHVDGVCAFAGHVGGWFEAVAPAPAAVRYAGLAAPGVAGPPDPAPGRGLAAPPPPNRGPPRIV